jgi:predicted PurR-regulated permease PerM
MIPDTVRQLAAALVVAAILVAALVVGRAILVPLAVAMVAAFMLAPITRWLSARSVPDGIAIGGVLAVVLAGLTALSLLLSVEIVSLGGRMGDYKDNIVAKVRTLASVGREDGALSRAADAVNRLADDVARELERGAAPNVAPDAGVPVVVRPVDRGAVDVIERLGRIAEPLAGVGLTLLFTLFLLLQHQDLRDRVVRVLGTDNLSGTTGAMSEAGRRLSRLFLTQAAINISYGLAVGVVLWLAGLPSPLLWGVLAGLMRFVPFIGSFVAALPPVLLAAAVEPGWGLVLFTAIFFLVSEVVVGNLVEPMVLGRSVGLSPFAMIAAASFRTLVWGGIGLLLAAPLTMTLVVIGRQLAGLSFLNVLLGDEPALSDEQELYQRLLSGDPLAAADELAEGSARSSLAQAVDAVLIPALRLAASDDSRGRLSSAQRQTIRETIDEVARLTPWEPPHGARQGAVLVVAGRGDIDIAAARFLAAAVAGTTGRPVVTGERTSGLIALTAGRAREGASPPEAVVIVTVATLPGRHLDLLAARALREFPAARVLVFGPGEPIACLGEAARQSRSVVELLANLGLEQASARNGPDAAPGPSGAPPV